MTKAPDHREYGDFAGRCAPERPAEPDAAGEQVLFDAVLTPHRSLSARGFLIFMTAVGGVSFFAGLMFFLAGAWPVMGFFGLDALLIYIAFRINYRRGRMFETVRLTPHDLTVRRVDHWGKATEWRFPPNWLQVLMDDPPAHESMVTLRSHGRSLVVGAFLSPEERLDFARALSAQIERLRAPLGA
ncbi:MAG: DUF2244 domain-containing protein [Rhodovibrionaceae bacterium]|nr:DUF2244 domain-containing protein [Rhodovibrionaceae bacterium]